MIDQHKINRTRPYDLQYAISLRGTILQHEVGYPEITYFDMRTSIEWAQNEAQYPNPPLWYDVFNHRLGKDSKNRNIPNARKEWYRLYTNYRRYMNNFDLMQECLEP